MLAEDLNGDLLVFTVDGPSGMSIDPETGLLQWTPDQEAVGAVAVAIMVEDPHGAFDEQTYELLVEEGRAAPTITSVPVLVGLPGTTYQYPAMAEDPDDTDLFWSVDGPPGMWVDESGLVEWDVSDTWGNTHVTLTVQDAAGHSDGQDFSIGVSEPGDPAPPTIEIVSPSEDTIWDVPMLRRAARTATNARMACNVGRPRSETCASSECGMREWSSAPSVEHGHVNGYRYGPTAA